MMEKVIGWMMAEMAAEHCMRPCKNCCKNRAEQGQNSDMIIYKESRETQNRQKERMDL